MRKNFLISTGGSGGHVLPAQIIFEHLSNDKDVTISTDRRGLKYLEKDICLTQKIQMYFKLMQ